MTWIWQHAEWPSFVWDRSRLALLEDRFLHESGRRVGAWRHLPDQARTDLRIEWLSEEALDTSAIEGKILNRASVQSSIRLQFGLSGDPRRVTPAEAGVAAMQVVSGPDYRRRVHYEAPPSDRVATEMDRFIRWYGRTGSMPALTRRNKLVWNPHHGLRVVHQGFLILRHRLFLGAARGAAASGGASCRSPAPPGSRRSP